MSRTEKVLVHGSTWLVSGSGLAYAWMKYFLRNEDPYSAIHHPLQPAALAWHVVCAPLLVFAVGLIAREHILSRVKEGGPPRGRRSGLAAALLVVPMVLSGYGLQVVISPAARAALIGTHLSSGLLFLLLYVVHSILSRRAERRARRAAEAARGEAAAAAARVERRRQAPGAAAAGAQGSG